MSTAHSFFRHKKTGDTPSGLLEKYLLATKKLIEELRTKGYQVLITEYSSRGVPNSIIVVSPEAIPPVDIKDDFRTTVQNIRIKNKLGIKLWNFEPGEIYSERA